MSRTGIIILAAGNSSRLGRPKQLLPFQNTSFIQRIASEAARAKLFPIILVTGANAEKVLEMLSEESVQIIFNEKWQQGMASSIVAGLSKLILLDNKLEKAIIAVCDQPFVSAELFQLLIEMKAESGKGIIACDYAETLGVPVLFGRPYFESLLQLKGEEGAKKLLKLYEGDVASVPFPQGHVDIDTEDDYLNLLNR